MFEVIIFGWCGEICKFYRRIIVREIKSSDVFVFNKYVKFVFFKNYIDVVLICWWLKYFLVIVFFFVICKSVIKSLYN